jgi:hypothetical protein
MEGMHPVQSCRWGTPTLFLAWPMWCDASRYEWSCTRIDPPTVLTDSANCQTCPRWEPMLYGSVVMSKTRAGSFTQPPS